MKNERTHTPEQDWEKFKMIHSGNNRTGHWIKQYRLVLEKYPNMRIYGWHKAVECYCEYNHMDYERPHFQPDLYLICSEYIVCFEIEHTSRWSEDKQESMMGWYIEMDAQQLTLFYMYRFDGYGNLQESIFPNAAEDLKRIKDCPKKHRKYFKKGVLHNLHMEQEILLDISQ